MSADDRVGAATRHLAASFRAGVPLRVALDRTEDRYGGAAWATPAAQSDLLNLTVLYGEHFKSRIPSFSFGQRRCRQFLRLVMDEIDRVPDGELDEEFVETAARYCQMGCSDHEEKVNIVLEVPNRITETGISCMSPRKELVFSVSEMFNNLGFRVWEAGLVLYYHIINRGSHVHRDVHGKRIMELGAGTGVCGSAYRDAGAKYALLTDYREDIVKNLKANIINNVADAEGRVDGALLDVEDIRHVMNLARDLEIDTILAADVTYDDSLAKNMVRAFEKGLQGQRVGYLVVTMRSDNSMMFLEKLFIESCLDVEQMQVNRIDEFSESVLNWDFGRVRMYRMQGKRP